MNPVNDEELEFKSRPSKESTTPLYFDDEDKPVFQKTSE